VTLPNTARSAPSLAPGQAVALGFEPTACAVLPP
jgi:hypothetical protein